MRVVLDANVLVSALISRAGAPACLLVLWLEGEFEVVVCETLLEEVEKTLGRPKISARVSQADADAFVRLLRELAEFVAEPKEPPAIRSADPNGDYLIAMAAREGFRSFRKINIWSNSATGSRSCRLANSWTTSTRSERAAPDNAAAVRPATPRDGRWHACACRPDRPG